MVNEEQTLNRWRLILGRSSAATIVFGGGETELWHSWEELLDYLYDHAGDEDVRTATERAGGLESSQLQAAQWITRVRELFPKKTADVLEKQALEEFHMTELLTDKETLEKITPDMNLLKVILQLRHLMKGEVLDTARRVAAQVAEELQQKLETHVRQALLGRVDRTQSTPLPTARNLDIKKTIQQNLKHYDPERKQLMLQEIYFHSRVKRHSPWHVILAIDESGSMTGSIIYAAVMAQILANLPFADVRLIVFDTGVVDLSEAASDPAQVLMSVQLGGGTCIGNALGYCEQLIETPARTCVVCVTDLYEGPPAQQLLSRCRNIIESGAKLCFLTALDEDANPAYDHRLGQVLANMGAFVGAMTPDRLGDYLGRIFG